jgi:hypothetical protein
MPACVFTKQQNRGRLAAQTTQTADQTIATLFFFHHLETKGN